MNFVEPKILGIRDTNHFTFTLGIGMSPLIDFGYVEYPNTIPWEAVQVQNGQDLSVFPYIAFLDRALEFCAVGRTGDARICLNSAAEIVPAENLEGARLATLRYIMTHLGLQDNVGRLQSLPLLHNAYELFLESENDPRFSRNDPLMNWVRGELEWSYRNWDWTTRFFDRVQSLKTVPHINDDVIEETQYTDQLSAEFQGRACDEIFHMLETNHYSSSELHFVKYLLIQKLLLHAMPVLRSDLNVNDALMNVANEGELARPSFEKINTLLSKNGKLDPDLLTIRLFDFLDTLKRGLPEFPHNASDEDVEKFIVANEKQDPLLKDVAQLVLQYKGGATTNGVWNAKGSHWWQAGYMIWFTEWCGSAVRDIERENYPWNTNQPSWLGKFDVKGGLSRFGEAYFTKDAGGTGETFVPGLFFMAWYEQTFKIAGADELKRKFQAETGLTFDSYLASLYPP